MRGIVLYIYEDICKEMMLLVIKAVLNNDIVSFSLYRLLVSILVQYL